MYFIPQLIMKLLLSLAMLLDIGIELSNAVLILCKCLLSFYSTRFKNLSGHICLQNLCTSASTLSKLSRILYCNTCQHPITNHKDKDILFSHEGNNFRIQVCTTYRNKYMHAEFFSSNHGLHK